MGRRSFMDPLPGAVQKGAALVRRLLKALCSIVRCGDSMKRALSHPVVALLVGLALRLVLLFDFPATSGDSELYENLATNWLRQHAYALNLNGALTPVDVR